MLFSTRKNIEQAILGHLQKGPLFTSDLLKLLQITSPSVTKQGMYSALRKLLRSEIILKHKKQVSLNVAWLTKMESFISLAEHFYVSVNRSGSFLGLADGEKIKYEFRNLAVTDAFWNHVVYLLIETHPKKPWFGYNPHCWFFLARPESERALRDFIVKKGGQYLLTVGARKPLDKFIQKEFDGEKSQYFMREKPLFKQSNYYVNIVCDYIVEVWFNPAQAKVINDLYESSSGISADIQERLAKIISSSGKTKLLVSRDQKKSDKMRSMLAKSFYLFK
jgi:hypothetical protein